MCGEFVLGAKAVLVPREGRSRVVEVLFKHRQSVVCVLDKHGTMMRE